MTTIEAIDEPQARPTPFTPTILTGRFAKPRGPDPAPTPTQVAREIHWEADAVKAGVKRYRAELNNRALADTSPGQRIMREIMDYFVPGIAEFQEKVAAGIPDRGKKDDWSFLVLLLEPEALAYLTLRAIMSERPTENAHERLFTSCMMALANSIELEVSFRDWVAQERVNKREAKALGKPYQDLYERMKRSVKAVNERTARAWMRRFDRLNREPWPKNTKILLGGNLIDTVMAGSEYFEVDYALRGQVQGKPRKPGSGLKKTWKIIKLSDAAREMIEDEHTRLEIMRPPHRPMLCQPTPWQWEDGVAETARIDGCVDAEPNNPGRYVGGYLKLATDLIHSGPYAHTAALENPLGAETLRAINTLQSTPWRVNRAVYNVMREAMDAGSRLGDLLPPAEPEFLGDRFPDEVWKTMAKEAKDKENARREKIHTENAHNESHRYAWRFRMDMAGQVLDEPMIWFPHGADFRGRLYAEVNDLSPQGSDEGKALLEFGHGKPLGEDGLAWLYIRAASCYATEKTPTGDVAVDKLPFKDREKWAKDHLDRIHEAAADPIDGTKWWTEAEDPWCFLATCFEISAAVRGDPRTFISHLPVPLDGSCNGLQHLSALGRDREGALATNVISDTGERRDIYSEVAEHLKLMVAADAGKGNKLALEWQPKIKRSLVKRAVMTTPYGVSERGIGRQLLKDRHTDGLDNETAGADYLKEKLVKAIDDTVSAATKIKAWLAAVAGALVAAHDIPFRWQTPTGNTLQQAYWELKTKKVKTLAGQITLQVEQPVDPVLRKQQKDQDELRKQAAWQQHLADGGGPHDKKKVMRRVAKELREGRDKAGLRKRKQQQSASPNVVVHSFDAAHLCRTVNACSDEWLLRDFAMIHDSFGVHAADTTLLSDVLRKQFLKIYEGTNWLQRIEDYVRSYAPDAKIPSWSESEYVTLGDLQLYPGVLRSEHFFS
jgi:DNA-directed RNA polymerase